MKRFKITNRSDGREFLYESVSIRPHQPEYGPDPIIEEEDITALIEEKAAYRAARFNRFKNVDKAGLIELREIVKDIGFKLGFDKL